MKNDDLIRAAYPKLRLMAGRLMRHERDNHTLQPNPRTAKLVEICYYGGPTNEEIGACLGITPRTVERNWETARHWLFLALKVDG